MQQRAAPTAARSNGGWTIAFVVAACAVIASAAALVAVVFGGSDGPPTPAGALPPDSSSSTATPTASPAASENTGPTATPTPKPRATLVPSGSRADASPPVAPQGGPFEALEDESLRAAIETALGDRKDDVSVAVIRPADGKAALVDADRVFYAASLFKLAVLYEAGVRLSSGELGLEDRLVLTETELEEDLGTIEYVELADDGSIAVADALEAMVTFSDNSIAVGFLHVFGSGAVDATLRSIGLETTSVNTTDLPTTAREMARLMTAIVAGEGLDAGVHELLMGILTRQQIRSGIPAGLPDGVLSGNKTGTWDALTHDVAWVKGPSDIYVVAVLTDDGVGWAAIAAVSSAVYAALEPS